MSIHIQATESQATKTLTLALIGIVCARLSVYELIMLQQ